MATFLGISSPRRNDDMFLKQRSVIALYNANDYHNKDLFQK